MGSSHEVIPCALRADGAPCLYSPRQYDFAVGRLTFILTRDWRPQAVLVNGVVTPLH